MEAMGEATQGIALIFLGRLSEGVPLLEDAVPTLLAAGQRQEVAEITLALNGAHLAMGSLQRGRELGEQMLPIAQSLNDPVDHRLSLRCILAPRSMHWGTGRPVRPYLRRADELFATVELSSLAVRTISFRAPPLIWEGDWAKARRLLQTALQVARCRGCRSEPAPGAHLPGRARSSRG